jgi:hypothetical protein
MGALPVTYSLKERQLAALGRSRADIPLSTKSRHSAREPDRLYGSFTIVLHCGMVYAHLKRKSHDLEASDGGCR